MRAPSQTVRASISAAVLIASACIARGQSYGVDHQVLVVPAAAFRPTDSTYPYHDSYEYVYSEGEAYFVAPLDLPKEPRFSRCASTEMFPPMGASQWASLLAYKQAPGGTTAGDVEIRYVSDDIPIGHGVVCTAPFSYTLLQVRDIDNDGALDNVAYVLEGRVSAAGFGGLRIFWRRQVSPAPGVATFNDVPTSDPFFQFVEALVSSGITAGCGNGNFCPDAPITRKQMAAFLAKALGMHWPTS